MDTVISSVSNPDCSAGAGKPTIIVDVYEKLPLKFTWLPCIERALRTGDYSIVGCERSFAIERKSVMDFYGCYSRDRERFEDQLHRLRAYRFRRLLMIGTRDQLSKNAKDYLDRVEVAFDCPVSWAENADVAARRIEIWAFYFYKELIEFGTRFRNHQSPSTLPSSSPSTLP